jgi:hypothetical protein
MIRAGAFIGLALLFPCPWYMLAVGGLLPLPVIVLYGLSGGIVLAFSLVHAIVYVWLFHRTARWLGALLRAGRVRAPVAAVAVLSTLLALSVLPIYGSGENLAAGYALRSNAYAVYRDAFVDVVRGGRR